MFEEKMMDMLTYMGLCNINSQNMIDVGEEHEANFTAYMALVEDWINAGDVDKAIAGQNL